VKNLTGVTSRDRTTTKLAYLYADHMTGNKSFDFIFMEDYYHLTSVTTRGFYVLMVPNCAPDIDTIQYMNYSNVELSLNNPEKNSLKASTMIMGSNQSNYVKIISIFTNFHIHDHHSPLYPLVWMSAPHDLMYASNITIDD
jgi:hypothetical protein